MPALPRRAPGNQVPQADRVLQGQGGAASQRDKGHALGNNRRRHKEARIRPGLREARMDGANGASGASGEREAEHHARNRREERGRPHAQARGHNQDKPEARGEHKRRRAPAHHRGPLGTAPVPLHDFLRQRDREHTSCKAQERKAPENPCAKIERKRGAVQVQPERKARQFLRPYRDFSGSAAFNRGSRGAAGNSRGAHNTGFGDRVEPRNLQEPHTRRELP
ncbi:Uncharacterised protein [uncultured archaeon]|nr:Uncharacterised protein [uncultured archaeon]